MNYSKNYSKSQTFNKNQATNSKPWAPKPEKQGKDAKTKQSFGKFSFEKHLEKESFYNIFDADMVMKSMQMKQTENGAWEYGTTGKALLDIHYQLSSLRGKTEKEIIDMWRKAFVENNRLAIRWLFYATDVRQGAGERRTFQIIIKDIIQNGGDFIVANLVPLIPEYSRWDMLYTLLEVKSGRVYTAVKELINKQWHDDIHGMNDDEPISLMAKWLKSSNSHCSETRLWGIKTAEMLGISEVQYRKTLSRLRKYLDVVERKMSSNNWQAIDYEKVPSKANLNYSKAFMRHDERRRQLYLDALKNGEAKINSSVLFPHEIVHKYFTNGNSWCCPRLAPYSQDVEALWEALPNMITSDSNTLVVCDGSGSMWQTLPSSKTIQVEEVAYALSIYFAQHNHGFYHNRVMTFSTNPRFFELDGNSLHSALREMMTHTECANTNIEAVFDLILNTAIRYRHNAEDMPEKILIVSDGEWDSMAVVNSQYCNSYSHYRSTREQKAMSSVFEIMEKRYAEAGYKLPHIVFWNVANRSGTMPIGPHSTLPCTLVSGFSTNIFKQVLSNKTSPWEVLVDTIMDKRYDAVESAAFDTLAKKVVKTTGKSTRKSARKTTRKIVTGTTGKKVTAKVVKKGNKKTAYSSTRKRK